MLSSVARCDPSWDLELAKWIQYRFSLEKTCFAVQKRMINALRYYWIEMFLFFTIKQLIITIVKRIMSIWKKFMSVKNPSYSKIYNYTKSEKLYWKIAQFLNHCFVKRSLFFDGSNQIQSNRVGSFKVKTRGHTKALVKLLWIKP